MDYRVLPPDGWLEASVRLPLSKSMSARALVINALAGDTDASAGMTVADCDDTRAIADALSGAPTGEKNVGGAGTAMRFLTAFYAATPGCEVTLDGDSRMRQRPIGQLVDALRAAGATIDYLGQEGFPPLKIKGSRLKGGALEIDATVSSQYVSALAMVAPTMTDGLKLTLRGEAVSLPYVRMTLEMMRQAGADAEFYGGDTVEIAPGKYTPVSYAIEGDWSSAAPWYMIEALSSGEVVIENIESESIQGDSALAAIFNRLGVTTDFEPEEAEGTLLGVHPDPDARLDIDMTATPDIVPAVTVTCCMLGIPFHITGLASLAIKECDRIEALVMEMDKVGVTIERPAAGEISWNGRRHPILELPRFATYGDHRMAMALAPVSIFVPEIIVEDVEVVSKSYPGFWDDLSAAGFTLTPVEPAGEEAEA